MFVTVPRWHELVEVPVEVAGGSKYVIIITYAIMMISQMLHTVSHSCYRNTCAPCGRGVMPIVHQSTQIAFFRILGTVGAVATGIMSGLRAVSVFFVSAMMFCAYQESQCLNITR